MNNQMSLPYIVQRNSVTVFVNKRPRVINDSHISYAKIIQAIQTDDWATVTKLVDSRALIAEYTNGRLSIVGDKVLWDSVEVKSGVAKRVIEMFKQGFNIDPMVKFIANALKNPSSLAIEELFTFLEANNLPITPSGKFLAYKKVTKDYKDCYTREIDNSIGQVVSMPRDQVNADRTITCSTGLHACSLDYLKSFEGDRTVVVEIDPADFVSCPTDYNRAKIRVCRYLVVDEIASDPERAFEHPVHPTKPKRVLSMTPNAIRKRERRAALKNQS